MWKIETLMELAVLLCELLLCSFPNGEKFNYQLICCVVSGDMKFPIVSTSIKRSASTQLFRQLNAKIAGGHNEALIRFVLQMWHHMCQQHNILILHSETFQILNTMFSANLYLLDLPEMAKRIAVTDLCTVPVVHADAIQWDR